nr:GspE/PulE family protein [Mesoaciditoga lauensis]
MASYKRIGEILVSKGYITTETLERALEVSKRTGKPVGRVLVENNFVTWDDIAEALATQYGLPKLEELPPNVPYDVLNAIPRNLVSTYRIIPYKKEGNTIFVATDSVLNYTQVVREIRFVTGMNVKVSIIPTDMFDAVYQSIYGSQIDTGFAPEFEEIPREREIEMPTEEEEEEEEESEEAPAVRLVRAIIEGGIVQGASDIHIEPSRTIVSVRYRIDGILKKVTSYPIKTHSSIVSRIKIMSGLDISEKRLPQDGKYFMRFKDEQYDFRVSTMPTVYGEKIVMRILKVSASQQRISDLGFSEYNTKRFMELINYPYGIILLTGPTGSGKSTTLVAAINEIKDVTKNIITVEDPVEYNIDGVNQCQVNAEIGLTYARFLRAILRQDPNIIMVGEIRDRETAQLAMEASMTGHLVFSTLHTNDAPSAISRLVNLGLDPHMIGVSLIGVVGQRLVRKLCNECKTEVQPNEEVLKVAKKLYPHMEPKMYAAGRCPTCQSGYSGRTAINEVMIVTPGIRELLYRGASDTELREEARRSGMRTMFEDGIEKILRGITSYEEITRVVRDE